MKVLGCAADICLLVCVGADEDFEALHVRVLLPRWESQARQKDGLIYVLIPLAALRGVTDGLISGDIALRTSAD